MELTPAFAILRETFLLADRETDGGLVHLKKIDFKPSYAAEIICRSISEIIKGLEFDLDADQQMFEEFKLTCYLILILNKQHYSAQTDVDNDALTGNLPTISRAVIFEILLFKNMDEGLLKVLSILEKDLMQNIIDDFFDHILTEPYKTDDVIRYLNMCQEPTVIDVKVLMLNKLSFFLRSKCEQSVESFPTTKTAELIMNCIKLFRNSFNKCLFNLPRKWTSFVKKVKKSMDYLKPRCQTNLSYPEFSLAELNIRFGKDIIDLPSHWYGALDDMLAEMQANVADEDCLCYLHMCIGHLKLFLEVLEQKNVSGNEANKKMMCQIVNRYEILPTDLSVDSMEIYMKIVRNRLPNCKEYFGKILNFRDNDVCNGSEWFNFIRENKDLLDNPVNVAAAARLFIFLRKVKSNHANTIHQLLETSFKKLSVQDMDGVMKIFFQDGIGVDTGTLFPGLDRLSKNLSKVFNKFTDNVDEDNLLPDFAWFCLQYPEETVKAAVLIAIKHSGQTKLIASLLQLVKSVCVAKIYLSTTLLESVVIELVNASLSNKRFLSAKIFVREMVCSLQSSGPLLSPSFLIKNLVITGISMNVSLSCLRSLDVLSVVTSSCLSLDMVSLLPTRTLCPLLIMCAYELNECLVIWDNESSCQPDCILECKEKCKDAVKLLVDMLSRQEMTDKCFLVKWISSRLDKVETCVRFFVETELKRLHCSVNDGSEIKCLDKKFDAFSFLCISAFCPQLNISSLNCSVITYNELLLYLVKILPHCSAEEWLNIMQTSDILFQSHCIKGKQKDYPDISDRSFLLFDVMLVLIKCSMDCAELLHISQNYAITIKESFSKNLDSNAVGLVFMHLCELIKLLPLAVFEPIQVGVLDLLQLSEKHLENETFFKEVDDYLLGLDGERFTATRKKWTSLSNRRSVVK